MFAHRLARFIALGAVVLCVTGAEALYADMGHFGKRPIRLAWFGVVDAGAAAQLLRPGRDAARRPEAVGEPVLRDGAARWALYPLIALATLRRGDRVAGADHRRVLGHQAGDPARLPAAPAIQHTSVKETGQIYIAVRQLGPVLRHRHRRRPVRLERALGAAYGITVTIDMLITTTMTFFVVRYGWKYPWSLVAPATGFFFLVDFTFFAANVAQARSTAAGSRCSSARSCSR